MPDREDSDSIRVSVIIPVKNGMLEIGRCLTALMSQTYPRMNYEIIVVDDGSSDGTVGAADRSGVLLLTQEASGPAAARNLGARFAVGDILLFTDADCEPMPDWIEQMLKPFDDPDVAGVKGAYWSRQRSLTARFVQLEYESKYRRMRQFEQIDFIDTYSAGFRREIFWVAGGFDQSYPVACVEDQEFSFRLAESGYRLIFQPLARVFHQHAETPLRYIRKKYKIAYWKAKLLRRHPNKTFRDTHTPPGLKFEMPTAVLTLIGALVSVVSASASPVLIPLIFFLALTLPAAHRNFRLDPIVGAATPFYHFSRGLALSLGLLIGAIAHRRER